MNKDTALLIIDVQKDVVDWSEPLSNGSEVLKNINSLLTKARESNTPVIFIQHNGEDGGRLAVGSSGWEIHPAIAPVDGELIIGKYASDSFYETSLQDELNKRGIKHLVVVGCRTQFCVDTTCRSATSLGYNVTLAKDAHTTMNDVLTAAQIIAHHNSTLDDFGNVNYIITAKESKEITF
jgi:nicotinamidase-related amidase